MINKDKLNSGNYVYYTESKNKNIRINNHFLDRHAIIDIIRQRRTIRKTGSLSIDFSDVACILEGSLGVTKYENEEYFYATPCAGKIRELRYIIVVNKVRGFNKGCIYEYIPENSELIPMNVKNTRLFFESWELEANFNIIFCTHRIKRRHYWNNQSLANFEAGCCSQNLQLISRELGYASCISGIINLDRFYEIFPNLIPMQALSFSKEDGCDY